MTLRDLMGNGAPELEISGLAYSSQSVTPGTLFFCVPGFKSDGHDFAPDAVERGAVALVCQRPLDLGVPEVLVDDVRAAMGPAAARFYGDPTAELDVVGVTGTNGKTTTAFLVRHLVEADGRGCGLLGTVKRVVAGREEEVERTTPEAIDLQATFRAMLDGGDRACAMEVSSHALELGRVAGIRFACRVFTNLTQDHLDFHETMDAYFAAKRRLFDDGGPAVVNVDDEYGRRLAAEVDATTFAIDRDADYRALDVDFDLMGSRFRCGTPDGELELTSPLPGLFNVQNVLAAVAAAHALGVPLETDRRGAAALRARAGPLRAGRRGPGLRRAGGLRAHPRGARERAARGAPGDRGAPARGVRRRRRPRPRQAPADGRRRAPAGRSRAGHQRQPAQ